MKCEKNTRFQQRVSAILTCVLGLSFVLFGCSESSTPATTTTTTPTPTTNVSGTVTIAELLGTWLLACEAEATGGSSNGSVTLTDTTGDVNIATYDDANCQTSNGGVIVEKFTYILGPDFALDGTVAGITTGNEFDSINLTTGGSTSFNVIALVGNLLYIGDEDADPLKDTSTPAARPTKLDDAPLTKQ